MGGESAQERLVRGRETWRQVEHKQVDRPARDERAGEAQPLLRIGRTEHHEPAQVHAAGGRLERVEGPAEVQPGGDGAG